MGVLGNSMHSPLPAGTLRRPPFSQDKSSTSSLSSTEGSIQSFQNFIKRTPPPDPTKPLPPPPLLTTRRASSNSIHQSSTPSSHSRRRASSIYSRTISQWEGDGVLCTSVDFADEPLPPLSTLQALAYSASTPQLGHPQNAGGLLQPRMYRPLIVTPSPSESRVTLDKSSSVEDGPPAMIMSPIGLPKTIKQRLETISLEQAKAALRAPGAVHLLPEELRAQNRKRSQSQQPLRLESLDISELDQRPGPPEPPTMIDRQGRHRSIVSHLPNSMAPSVSAVPITGYVANSPYEKSFKVGIGPERSMIPRYLQELETPSDETTRNHGPDDFMDERGRQRRRSTKPMQALRQAVTNRDQSESSMDEGIGTREMAKRYSRLLSNPYQQASASLERHDTDSDGSVKARMKLVPQPLFRSKPPAKLPGTFSGPISQTSSSPSGLADDDETSEYGRRRSSASSKRSFPFQLSLSCGSSHRRRSTSGSIPISPPTVVSTSPPKPMADRQNSSLRRRDSPDYRVSAYYPHVASRKQKKTPVTKSKSSYEPPPTSFFSLNFNAGPVRDFDLAVGPSSLDRTNSSRQQAQSRDRTKQPIIRRVSEGPVGYIDQPTSPVKSPAAQAHLGWSSKGRAAFGEARQSIQSPRKLLGSPTTPRVPKYLHISTPARPLDETREGLREPDSPRRKGSLFGSMLDGWKESRAEKRREDLKKIIKVVPTGCTVPRS